MMSGIEMLHVPYRGSAPMLIDLLSGQVQLAFDDLPASIEHIRSGKLRALAVTTTTRSEALPDISSLSEPLPGFEGSDWRALEHPKRRLPKSSISSTKRSTPALLIPRSGRDLPT